MIVTSLNKRKGTREMITKTNISNILLFLFFLYYLQLQLPIYGVLSLQRFLAGTDRILYWKNKYASKRGEFLPQIKIDRRNRKIDRKTASF